MKAARANNRAKLLASLDFGELNQFG
ncbi:hypothetical protein LMED105_05557 [Limnobacter sp. MED105]|nr:hypothetical protein LMED105_05557 [Limnobacter sp. MED105]